MSTKHIYTAWTNSTAFFFSTACAGCASNTEAMVLYWKMLECLLRFGHELLPQMKDHTSCMCVGFVHKHGYNGACHWQTYWCSVSSNAGISQDCCDEKGAYLEGKAFNLWDTHSSPHLWSRSLGRMSLQLQLAKMSFLHNATVLTLRDESSSVIWNELRVEPLFHWNEPE